MDESTKARRKSRASRKGRSTDATLKEALSTTKDRSRNLAEEIHRRFAPFGGVELVDVLREPIRRPPDFK